jgi:hypothetical protein
MRSKKNLEKVHIVTVDGGEARMITAVNEKKEDRSCTNTKPLSAGCKRSLRPSEKP